MIYCQLTQLVAKSPFSCLFLVPLNFPSFCCLSQFFFYTRFLCFVMNKIRVYEISKSLHSVLFTSNSAPTFWEVSLHHGVLIHFASRWQILESSSIWSIFSDRLPRHRDMAGKTEDLKRLRTVLAIVNIVYVFIYSSSGSVPLSCKQRGKKVMFQFRVTVHGTCRHEGWLHFPVLDAWWTCH